jgi:hypothetical protein
MAMKMRPKAPTKPIIVAISMMDSSKDGLGHTIDL